MEDLNCCVVSCERPLDQSYWDSQWQNHTTGWDLGEVSPPIKKYIDSWLNKNSKILIPGCGSAYEAGYLLQQGFTNITVIDISPTLVDDLKAKFAGNDNISIVLGDFFAHEGQYDLIIEQTFFCALPLFMRPKYVAKMHQLLKPEGTLAGLLFNRTFESGPPFGGDKETYLTLFKDAFDILQMDISPDSALPRANTELFFEFSRNNSVYVTLYQFSGMTCSSCADKINNVFIGLEGVVSSHISSNFEEVLLVSQRIIDIHVLKNAIANEPEYSINFIDV